MQVCKSTCQSFAKYSYKYMKIKHQVKLLYFQIDKGLMCMVGLKQSKRSHDIQGQSPYRGLHLHMSYMYWSIKYHNYI
jgi:hypothetical protein